MITNANTFIPDYAIHPGEILEETLEVRNIRKNELAERCGMSIKTISQILNGKAPVTAETAILLERTLGVSADVWNNLDANYRLFEAKKKERLTVEGYKDWVKKFPLADLRRRGILPQTTDASIIAESLLAFFGVSSPEAWRDVYRKESVSYRKSEKFNDSVESIITWLRIGKIRSETILTDPFDKKIFMNNLILIRELTLKEPAAFESKMKQLCKESGVVLVFVPELKGTHLSGATMWVSSDKALIIMSLRHKSDDHFWFTFFHEAGHILFHGKKSIFIDETKMDSSREEQEADRFSCNILIPESEYNKFLSLNNGRFHENTIRQFAKRIGVAPGIVVGRLQHDGIIPYSYNNKLKKKFVLAEDATK